jgi:SAM-dependent methyltransferase
MFEKIGNVKLNLNYYSGHDIYSDGEIENELLNIVEKTDDFAKILLEDSRWPIMYHLDKRRQNILEWFDFGENKNLLEVGAGCGAITGLFCEKLERVVSIELSKKRALINATRNKNKENLEMIVGNFNDMVIEEKFDYITLIGVFEYSRAFTEGNLQEITFLSNLRKKLKKNGKLIIAIENKFGLKYWAGAREDHTGKFFDSLEGYPGVENVRTYSKNELTEILKKSGFESLNFYYPFPDYKLPRVLFSDLYLPKRGDLRELLHNFDVDRYKLFDEDLVYDQLIEDNNFQNFSNSFLIISESGIN